MSHIRLLGSGPLPFEASTVHAAAGLRAWQFARALADEGHRVDLLLLGSRPTAAGQEPAGGADLGGIRIHPLEDSYAQSAPALRALLDEGSPAAVVGASTYCSYLAARSGAGAPLWIDLNGDPMAEGQARAEAVGDERAVHDAWWMLAWCLRRGDRFSVVSGAQRYAALGQLGSAGRLSSRTLGEELVAVIPEACDLPPTPRAIPSHGEFVILFSGSFNTWIDGDTLFSALEIALAANSTLRFVATGGEVAGFVEEPWRRFAARVESLPEASRRRIELLGWIPSESLAEVESRACCGVVPERPIVERELGGQNRSLRWMARGIPVVTTALSEIGASIRSNRLGLVYEPGDARSLAEALLLLESDRSLASELGSRARAWVGAQRSIAATTAALRSWSAAPRCAADRRDGTADAQSRHQIAMLTDQLHLAAREHGV